jgi:hypothetical protein
MALKREVSLGVGLATAALVWGVYNTALPSVADVRVGEPQDRDIAASERTATWTSAAAVAGVSLLAKDPTVFIIGGAMVVTLAWWHRHANHFNPSLGSATTPSSRQVQAEEMTVGAGYSPAG